MGEPSTATNGVRARIAGVFANPEPLWLPLSIFGLLALAATFVAPHGWDLYAYWTVDPRAPYGTQDHGLSVFSAFFYAPPVAWAMTPLGLLSWPVAQAAWLALQLTALWLIAGRWALVLVLFPPVWLDITYGNINVLIAAAIALGFRYPGTWAFVLLTKVTPGIALLWFAVRREWRALALVAVVTVAVSAPTFLVPDLWRQWFSLLNDSRGLPFPPTAWPIPLLPRLAVAAVLVSWGGLTDRRWTVPVAATLAMPVMWPIALAPLAALASRRD